MPSITFDQPSNGNVNSPQPGLEVENGGIGEALVASSAEGTAVRATARGDAGVVGHSSKAAGVSGVSEHADGVRGVTSGGAGASGVLGESSKPATFGVQGRSKRGAGVGASSQEEDGVHAVSDKANGVLGRAQSSGRAGVWGLNVAPGGYGVVGLSEIDPKLHRRRSRGPTAGVLGVAGELGTGVRGKALKGDGVLGETEGAEHSGVIGTNTGEHGRGVSGFADNGIGVYAKSSSPTDAAFVADNSGGGSGVSATASAGLPGAAVRGRSNGSGAGVLGSSAKAVGVVGVSGSEGFGLFAYGGHDGVLGVSAAGPGVSGFSPLQGPGLFGLGNPGVTAWGGVFGLGDSAFVGGDVTVLGSFKVAGGPKTFRIDHPLDPANRYLSHAAVEAPELKTVYDGVVELDGDGQATVELPEWFEVLNGDLRYQLTAVGGAAPNLHVARESDGKTLEIAGGEAGLRVDWQISGVRRDTSALASPLVVEEDKSEDDRGRYLEPQLYGREPSDSVYWKLTRAAEEEKSRFDAAVVQRGEEAD